MFKKQPIIKGVKGFNKDLTCRGFQYKEGKTYTHKGDVKICNSGFHFCEYPLDVFDYYAPLDSVFYNVEGTGKTDKESSGDSKISCSKIKIGAKLDFHNLTDMSVKFILEKIDKTLVQTNTGDKSASTNIGYRSASTNTGDKSASTNIGYRSASTNTGDKSASTNIGYRSASTNTGDKSASTNIGYRSASTNTGDKSASTNTGDKSASTNTGDKSASTNTGDKSASTNTGDKSASTNTGYRSASTNTGDKSASTNTGYRSASTNTGDQSASTVEGKESVAMAIGYQNKAKGALGCWIVLSEWKEIKNENHIVDVQCVKVDGDKIKADVFYQLINGQFVPE